MRKKHYLRALGVGLTAAAMAGIGGGAYAISSVSDAPATIVTGPDHQRLTITLAPGQSRTFKLPASNDPVRIDLDRVSTNGGVQTPSEVFSALVNVDTHPGGMSWIGTYSDGSQKTGFTFTGGPAITKLVCGASCVIAWLNSKSVSSRTVTLKQNKATTSIRGTYVINMWY